MRTMATILLALFAGAPAWAGESAEAQTPYDVKLAPWPCWRGPYFNGSAPDQGIELIDDLGKAKLLWKSDVPIPAGHPSKATRGYWAGGYCSPIVAQGRVYVAYWTPPGRTDYAWTEADKDPKHSYGRSRNPTNNRDDLTADDVLHCFDAQTGKTIFRTVLSGKGLMRPECKSGSHLTPCWWDGKVYFSGSAGRNYCIDATTGEPLWDAETGMSKTQDAGKKDGKANFRNANRVNRAAPVAIDDVVAIADGTTLIGYDAANGTVLWQTPKMEGNTSVATPWLHGGPSTGSGQAKAYFICKGRLMEAKTGKVLWAISDPPGAAPSAVADDILVMPNRGGTYRNGMSDEKAPPKSMTAFRISPEKHEQLWQLAYPTPHGSQGNPGYIYRRYAYGRTYKNPLTGEREECFVRVPLATGKPEVLAMGHRIAILGYSPIAFEGFLLAGDAKKFLAVGGAGKPEIKPGPGPAANSTSCAYADGLLYFRTESNTDARLVCYDLHAN